MSLKHARVVTEKTNEDGSITITTEGYYEEKNSEKIETRVSIPTSHKSLAMDVIGCLDVMSKGTQELSIRIITDKQLFPQRIEKTWTVTKKKIK